MTTFTDQQARQHFDTVLETARQQGEVRIKAGDGQEFSVRAVSPAKSPLDIPGVDVRLSAEEIVQAVREGRERRATGGRDLRLQMADGASLPSSLFLVHGVPLYAAPSSATMAGSWPNRIAYW